MRNMTPSQLIPNSTMQAATICSIVVVVVAFSYTLVLSLSKTKKYLGGKPPPSPWRLPLVGNLHQIGTPLHRSLSALAAVHGPVMLLRLGQVPTIIVSSADAAREVLQAQDHVFANRPRLAIPRKLLYGCTDIAFAPDGPYWRHARKMCVHHLLSPRRVQAYRSIREEEVEALVRRVEQEACEVRGRSCGTTGIVHLTELLSGFAKDAVGRIVLGQPASGGEGWRSKVDTLLEETNALLGMFHFGDFFPWLAWVSALDGTDTRVRRAFERIDHILEEIIVDASRETGDGFVHVLLSLQEDSSGTEQYRLTKDNVKAILEDLFGAGTDAAIIVLEWAMAELLRNEEAMRRLQHEVRQSVSTNTAMITEQDLPAMHYLRAVVKETLRLHSPAPLLLPRESMQPTRIKQYDVPSNTMLIVNMWDVSRDPQVWESPEEFRPERFVGSGLDFRGRHFEFIPFGGGRRMCPGIDFGISITELALANLVGQFDWQLPEGETELDMEETSGPGLMSRKKAPLRAVATPRSGH